MFKIGNQSIGKPIKPAVVAPNTNGSGVELMRQRRKLLVLKNDKHSENKDSPPEFPAKT